MKKIRKYYPKKLDLKKLSAYINKNFDHTFYVPDSIFKKILTMIKSKTLCTRENHAVSMSFGMKLNKKKPLILMQNSGLGLSIDAMIGTYDLYNEGCIIFLSNRGTLDWEESQHKKWGSITKKILKSTNYKFYNYNTMGIKALEKANKFLKKKNKIVFVIFERGNIEE